MKTRISALWSVRLLVLGLILSVGTLARAQDAPVEEPTSADDTCLECHLDPDTTKTVNGKEVPLVIPKKAWEESVHADEGCAACHVDFDPDDVPHHDPIGPVDCTTCHDDGELTGLVHGAPGKPGEGGRPRCASCHGSHGIESAEAAGEPTRCLGCHEGIDKTAYEKSAHGLRGDDGLHATCADCHGSHKILPTEDHESPAHMSQLPETCGRCHEAIAAEYKEGMHWLGYSRGPSQSPTCTSCHDPHTTPIAAETHPAKRRAAMMKKCAECHLDTGHEGPRDHRPGAGFIKAYDQSIHAQTRGDGTPAATCIDCHAAHGPARPSTGKAAFSRANTSKTCGRCHEKVKEVFDASVHGQALMDEILDSATCTDCHGEHDILPPSDPKSRASAARISEEACGRCHGSVQLAQRYGFSGRVSTYSDSYHGLAVVGGSLRAANCASCHGWHDVLPSSDPRSWTHPDNLQRTCGECHEKATADFALIPVHTAYTEEEHPIAYTVKWIYILLILSVIGGMLLHNMVIYAYHVRLKWKHHRSVAGYQRYMRFEVAQHAILAITFTLLVISGFALKFPDSFWAQWLHSIGMDEELRRVIHRGAAIIMSMASLVQAGYFIFHPNGRRDIRAMLPTLKDAKDFWHNMMYYMGRRPTPPRFDRFDYTEKAEYLALIWGTAVMALTGLVLWFPEIVTSWAPWWTFDVAQVVHYYEAWLATLAILVWHFFFVMYHPREYPLSPIFMDGRMPEEEWRERHPLEYERVTGKPAHPLAPPSDEE